ncbi:hypothetical protein FHX52_3853 [Humibacillus xanthopallidus]|uniref:Tetratricopeptide repeat protein n=1 Tax=Humibacillus xanthopallidus TaxID=412689 RepID=A0A543PKN3_9MICO|nr:hypothetical protein [Humibacillus xanthopallidus]TQN44637.1 hypothetical protein FHX52_3853 [Humibacillus xanthopallidus]
MPAASANAGAGPVGVLVGDRVASVNRRYIIAMIHRMADRYEDAIEELQQVVELDRAMMHQDLHSNTAMLEQVRAELQQYGPRTEP